MAYKFEATDDAYGYSADGVAALKKSIEMGLLTDVSESMKDISKIVTSVQENWSGTSANNFCDILNDKVVKISEDIQEEYDDLESRINELQSMYQQQDEKVLSADMANVSKKIYS
ncbi:MAG: hypothetical protein R3Y13_02580 [bacterium]